MHCILIYNPASGRNRAVRESQVDQVAKALSAEGHHADVVATTGPGSAAAQARDAGSADVIFACGGDGTVHEVLQGLVSETGTHTSTLGIVPFGSANALARHLRLSLDPCRAAVQQLRGKPCIIPAGKIVSPGGTRYFVVMAGAGPDGALVYSLLAQHKSQLGRLAYYLHAARLFAVRRFHPFQVEIAPAVEEGAPVTRRVVSVMACRVGNLGGLFGGLTSRGVSLQDTAMHLHFLSPPAILSLPAWFLSGWLGVHNLNPFLHRIDSTAFSCRPLNGHTPHLQADGEWLGRLPMQVSLVPDALRILLPRE